MRLFTLQFVMPLQMRLLKLHNVVILYHVIQFTLVWQTMEIWRWSDMEVQRQAGALVSQNQVLVCPVVTGHLAKQQLLL